MVNEAESYGVRIKSAKVGAGQEYWRVALVRHLTPVENAGKHHIFIDCLNRDGKRVYGTRLRAGWQDGEDEVVIDKPPGEAGTDVPLWKGQVRWVEVKSGIPSDQVENVHTSHPDEGPGNTLFHHSFYVVFQRAFAGGEPPVPPPSTGKTVEHYVLLGPKGVPGQRTNLAIIEDYMLKCGPTCGFRLDEAKNASRVTIVGGTGTVSENEEKALRQAGCEVKRIAGDSYAVEAAFATLPCYKVNWGG